MKKLLVLLLLLWATPASAQVGFVQACTNNHWFGPNTPPVTETIVCPTSVGAGHLLLLCAGWVGTTSTPNTPTGNSNTFVALDSQADGTTFKMECWYAKNTNSGATTLSVVWPSVDPGNGSLVAIEISGADTTAPLDQHIPHVQTNPGTGANAVTSTAQTTTANGEYIMGITVDDNFGGLPSAGTSPNAFTSRTTDSTFEINLEEFIQTTAGSIAATFTNTAGSGNNITMLATFKASGGGGGGSTLKTLTLLGVGTQS